MQALLDTSDGFRLLPHLMALVIAYVLALPIGWNREKEERSAGPVAEQPCHTHSTHPPVGPFRCAWLVKGPRLGAAEAGG